MFRGFQDKRALPDEVTRQLEEMLFGVPSSTAVYLVGLAVVPIAFWWRSHDETITAIAAVSVVLNFLRVAIVGWFNSRYSDRKGGQPALYWTVLLWVGGLYSLVMAALAVRAFILGELLSIALAVITVAGYITGVVIRASAVPRLAVPHILLVFVPIIIASASVPDKAYLSAGFLLSLFCVGCIELSKTVHERMKAQLLAEHSDLSGAARPPQSLVGFVRRGPPAALQLSLLARTDYLTGLPNRASFDAHGTAQLQDALAGRRSGFALALIDLDGFKSVNDAHGHAAGDELLKEVSNRIRSVLDGRHFAVRLGGDEFAIVFDPDSSLDDAEAVGDEIVRILNRPFKVADSVVQISGSVGLAAFEAPADSFTSIVARADQALYRAKNGGRNQTQVLVASILSPSIAPVGAAAYGTVSVQA
ncbi:MAG: putative signal transduction sensory box domain, transrane protein [Tardiphaga sp.]|nr:putative signal transduction sensory box domain, transrane protein [Tardiphaga sp.]